MCVDATVWDDDWADRVLASMKPIEPTDEPLMKQGQIWQSNTCGRQIIIVKTEGDTVLVRYSDELHYTPRKVDDIKRLYFLLRD